MFLRKAGRRSRRFKLTLIGVAAVLALSAATALAATITGDGLLVGTSGNDTINAGMGNDQAYGQLGKDTINAGNGNDVLDGDGKCSKGMNGQGNYCEDGQQQGDQGDTINAGNGNDIVYGGGGHNTINVGTGMDQIYGGPLGDTINVRGGSSSDTIQLGSGASYTGSTVNLAGGFVAGVVYAANSKKDTINCNGSPATVHADRGLDVLNSCPHVSYTAAARDGVAVHHQTATKKTSKRTSKTTSKKTSKKTAKTRARHARTHH